MSDSEDETIPRGKLFGRQRSIHDVLGGGKVADVLLWKKKNVSGSLSIGMTVIWFLFEVVEYNFVTLFCHFSITAMLMVFIWCTGADFFNWNSPKIPKSILDGQAFHEVASAFHERFNQALSKLLDIACGKDPRLFILTVVSLYILSVIGSYFTFLNFLYLVFVCSQTLPFLYDRYEEEVDEYVGRLFRQAKKTYRRFDSRVLKMIPRGTVKDKVT
ncbi:hypothetical protein P3X46_002741 [Hevea brasiliensis]|uniref:Reticulon-like protein n=1 Tax=Hevea brasiliensis TaxID=3981 RepID=A0ABQ9N3X9_HEVBR|nr:reticulon-like protein B9 [Hevea brasiliensis]KAJ9187264.1 hypothetical protein P3X46_002741 [Hevea brasiliensis]